jgi:hypothetical protein
MKNFAAYLNQDENIGLSSTRQESNTISNGVKRYPLNTVTFIVLFIAVNNVLKSMVLFRSKRKSLSF